MSVGVLTVLLVDDEPDLRTVTRLALQQDRDVRVIEAESGAKALALAASHRPDVVLLDVMMPDMDGPDVLRALARHPDTASIPIIFLTAKIMPGELQRLRHLGARSVITKPFDPKRLVARIRDALSERQDADGQAAPQAAAPSGALDVTALAKLADLTGDGGRSLVVELTDLFATQTPLTLAALRARGGDAAGAKEAERLAHSLKSAAATLGAVEISAWAASIERLASDGRLGDVPPLIDRIERALAPTLALIRLECTRLAGRPS